VRRELFNGDLQRDVGGFEWRAMNAKIAKTSNRGSKPGERRGGRQKGVPNKVTAELKDLARQYTQDALDALVEVVRGESDAARVAAARELLDRGYGKASQVLGSDPDNPLPNIFSVNLVRPSSD
jgi:hypothetical protein